MSNAGTGVRDKDAEFSEYMAARQPSLLRTAYLLTGDPHTAEDLVQTALAKLRADFGAHREDAEGFVKIGASPVDSTLPATELAATTGVASMILNLDETITKN